MFCLYFREKDFDWGTRWFIGRATLGAGGALPALPGYIVKKGPLPTG